MSEVQVEIVSMVHTEDTVDAVYLLNTADIVGVVERHTATKVSAHIANLTAIVQMDAESCNALRREETTMSAFASRTGYLDTSKSIESPTNI